MNLFPYAFHTSRGISPSPVSLYIHRGLQRLNRLSGHQKVPLSNLATSSSAEPPIVSASTLSVFAASYACVATGRGAGLSGRWRRVREHRKNSQEWPSHSNLLGHLGHLGQILPICAYLCSQEHKQCFFVLPGEQILPSLGLDDTVV